MPAADEARTDLPWRKRHPVLSRTILYVLGIGLTALLVHLFLERRETDEADRQAALAKELDDLGAVLIVDPEGKQVLKVLDEKFSDPGLPVKIRGRALRWRALALRKAEDFQGAEAALTRAEALDLEAFERTALMLEWAELKLEAGDPEAAKEKLSGARVTARPVPLTLLRTLLLARAEQDAGEPRERLTALASELAALRAPLDTETTVYVGGRDWNAAQLATVATEGLVRLGGASRPVEAWRRLARLARDDFDGQIVCARGLLGAGLEAEARAAFARARHLDATLAEREANKDPELFRIARP